MQVWIKGESKGQKKREKHAPINVAIQIFKLSIKGGGPNAASDPAFVAVGAHQFLKGKQSKISRNE